MRVPDNSNTRKDLKVPDYACCSQACLPDWPAEVVWPAAHLQSVVEKPTAPKNRGSPPENHLGRTGALATCAGAATLQGATRTELVVRTDSISIQTSNVVPRTKGCKHRLAEAVTWTITPAHVQQGCVRTPAVPNVCSSSWA